jgi:hypothetical protein
VQTDVADRHPGVEQRRLERIGAAERKGDQVIPPQVSDIRLFRHRLAIVEYPIARQIAAHVDIVAEAGQGGIAGFAARDQRTGLGVGRAIRRELVGPVGRQDHQVGLQVARRHARGHRGVAASPDLLAKELGGIGRREDRWRVHLVRVSEKRERRSHAALDRSFRADRLRRHFGIGTMRR